MSWKNSIVYLKVMKFQNHLVEQKITTFIMKHIKNQRSICSIQLSCVYLTTRTGDSVFA